MKFSEVEEGGYYYLKFKRPNEDPRDGRIIKVLSNDGSVTTVNSLKLNQSGGENIYYEDSMFLHHDLKESTARRATELEVRWIDSCKLGKPVPPKPEPEAILEVKEGDILSFHNDGGLMNKHHMSMDTPLLIRALTGEFMGNDNCDAVLHDGTHIRLSANRGRGSYHTYFTKVEPSKEVYIKLAKQMYPPGTCYCPAHLSGNNVAHIVSEDQTYSSDIYDEVVLKNPDGGTCLHTNNFDAYEQQLCKNGTWAKIIPIEGTKFENKTPEDAKSIELYPEKDFDEPEVKSIFPIKELEDRLKELEQTEHRYIMGIATTKEEDFVERDFKVSEHPITQEEAFTITEPLEIPPDPDSVSNLVVKEAVQRGSRTGMTFHEPLKCAKREESFELEKDEKELQF